VKSYHQTTNLETFDQKWLFPVDSQKAVRTIIRIGNNAAQIMVAGAMDSIYSDELITATELNRQPGRILDKALEHPVTITRNDQSFALLRRENVALLVKAAQRSQEIVELLSTAFRLLLKQKIGTDHFCSWLGVFDTEELNEFIDEVTRTYRLLGLDEKAGDELDAIIHEWHESALAISNPELEAAFNQNLDGVEIFPSQSENVVV
jgi:hypothetical protein